MEYVPFSGFGFEFPDELVPKFELSEKNWKMLEIGDPDPTFDEFEEKFGVRPTYIIEFEYERGGYYQGLTGFEYNKTYLIFDDDDEDALKKCKFPVEVDISHGKWSQLV